MRLMSHEELVQGWDASVPESYSKFLVSDVPTKLHSLIPYAQIFGITDDGYRSDLLRRTPRPIALHVRSVVLAHNELLSAWLISVEASKSFTEASDVFTALLIAADSILPSHE